MRKILYIHEKYELFTVKQSGVIDKFQKNQSRRTTVNYGLESYENKMSPWTSLMNDISNHIGCIIVIENEILKVHKVFNGMRKNQSLR